MVGNRIWNIHVALAVAVKTAEADYIFNSSFLFPLLIVSRIGFFHCEISLKKSIVLEILWRRAFTIGGLEWEEEEENFCKFPQCTVF